MLRTFGQLQVGASGDLLCCLPECSPRFQVESVWVYGVVLVNRPLTSKVVYELEVLTLVLVEVEISVGCSLSTPFNFS